MDENVIKRMMPHSDEAEQSVIGSMLYSEDAIATAMSMLRREDFYQTQYGIIFETILEIYQSGRSVDLITLQNVLRSKDVAPEVYSLDFLKELLNSVFTASNVKSYATIVAEKAQMRRMIKTFEEMTDAYYMGKEAPKVLAETTEKRIFDLLDKRSENTFENIQQITLNTIMDIEKASKSKGGITGLETGFKYLDKMTNGFQRSDLIIIAGRPAMGKTAFALNIADYFAIKKGYTTAIFELEMGRKQLCSRILAMESHVDSSKLRSGQLSDAEWDDIVAASSSVSNSKLIIDDTSSISMAELRSRCRRYKLEFGLDAVIVDYLQLMSGSGKSGDNRQQEISEISRGLKGLARELDVPVIALSQLSRGPEARTDHRPMLADLRESGSIEQDADIVMFIYRDEVYNKDSAEKGIAEVIIAKHRAGEIGTVKLGWQANLTKFVNVDFTSSHNQESQGGKE